jgi:uncharacterized RmlC-like cupin family protein
MAEIRVRGTNELDAARASTVGMVRGEAPLSENSYAVEVRTQPGAVSGWHHHGDHETYGYVVAGRLRFEFGAGGGDVVEAGPGDFFMVPANTIHREANPASDDQILVGFRIGSGPTVINVERPE